MNIQTKVGLFVLIALVISGVGIMKLSDVRFERRYELFFLFDDIGNLREKSAVKMAGVEVGRVDSIELENGKAKLIAKINKDIAVFEDGVVRVKATGIIGTQFLDLNPGGPPARQLKEGDTLKGFPTRSLNEVMEQVSELLEGKGDEPGMGENLQATVKNLRSITDSLNYAIGLQRTELKDMVQNLHKFSVNLKEITGDIRELTAKRKGDVDIALEKMRSILVRVDNIIAKVQEGEGSLGKILSDKQMGDEVKQTVSNLKDTTQSAKEVLARFTKVRSYWEFQLRAVPQADSVRGDGGIRLQPREDKYYYLGINNGGDRKDEFKEIGDYEEKNTVTAILAKRFGPVTVEAGAIRSTVGVGLHYYPFRDVLDDTSPNRWLRRIELNAEAFDFGRDEMRGRAGRERLFDKPQYNIGARFKITRWLDIGASIEDLAILKQYNLSTHLLFEDKDLAYLFGFVSFAR